MALTTKLRSCTCTFSHGGGAYVEAQVEIVDSVLGTLGVRVVSVTDSTLVASIRGVAESLLPPLETETGLALTLP